MRPKCVTIVLCRIYNLNFEIALYKVPRMLLCGFMIRFQFVILLWVNVAHGSYRRPGPDEVQKNYFWGHLWTPVELAFLIIGIIIGAIIVIVVFAYLFAVCKVHCWDELTAEPDGTAERDRENAELLNRTGIFISHQTGTSASASGHGDNDGNFNSQRRNSIHIHIHQGSGETQYNFSNDMPPPSYFDIMKQVNDLMKQQQTTSRNS